MHLGDVEFSTDLIGNSSESAFKLRVSSSHVLLVDSIQDASESIGTTQIPHSLGVDFWKVSFRLLIDGLFAKM